MNHTRTNQDHLYISTTDQARELLRLPKISSIMTTPTVLNDMDRSLITQCRNLREIRIEEYRGGPLDLSFLEDMASIDSLRILNKRGFEVLEKKVRTPTTIDWILPERLRVSDLKLYGILPAENFMNHVSRWEVKKMTLQCLEFTDDDYHLLSEIHAHELEMTDCTVPRLPDIHDVKVFDLGAPPYGSITMTVLDFNNLNSDGVEVIDINLKDVKEVIQPVKPIPRLQTLRLSSLAERHSLELDKLSGCLHHLYICRSVLYQKTLEEIRRISSLKTLSLQKVELATDISILDDHECLQKLDIKLVPQHARNIVINTPRLQEMRKLSIEGEAIDQLNLMSLEASKNLERLSIDVDIKTRFCLDSLSDCTKLYHLIMITRRDDYESREIDVTPLLRLKSLAIFDSEGTSLSADIKMKNEIQSPALLRLDENNRIRWIRYAPDEFSISHNNKNCS